MIFFWALFEIRIFSFNHRMTRLRTGDVIVRRSNDLQARTPSVSVSDRLNFGLWYPTRRIVVRYERIDS